MRTVLWDKNGDPVLYHTGSGVVYTIHNQPLAVLMDPVQGGYREVVDFMGHPHGWYKDGLMWDCQGKFFAFQKGKEAPVELPQAKPLRQELKPLHAPGHPLAMPSPLPEFKPEWSKYDVVSFFGLTPQEVKKPIAHS